jgi:gas vesicle protein
MKTKIVLWGTDDQDQKLLITIELLAKENKVRILTFSEEVATEEFYNQMMNLWRNGNPVIIPENHQAIDRDLNVTENLLPDNIKADRTDLINRAKTEWHFVVLSAKLYESFRSEMEELSTRINELTQFDEGVWEEMKAYWKKVQSQVREENLFREHANELRNSTNKLFDRMKGLKKKLDSEFHEFSHEQARHFTEILQDVEDRIEKGLGLQPIFNELKNIQKKFNETKFTREDRSKIWKRMDKAFKTIKEKRFGSRGKDSSPLDRLSRRYDGLMAAINKMERSINRDQNDINFQTQKIDTSDGQLEMQIRQAKLKMIEERIRSKRDKLAEMLKTKEELDTRMAREKERAEAKVAKKKEAEKDKTPPVKKSPATEENIAVKSKPSQKEGKEPAEESESKEKEYKSQESLLGAIGTTMGEALEDVVDTVKAVAEVVSDKVEEKIEELKKDDDEATDAPAENEANDDDEADKSILGNISDAVGDVVDKVKAAAEVVSDKVEEAIEEITKDEEE